MAANPIVSRSEWLDKRKALLQKEKDFTRARDRLNAERRALPWVRVDKQYVFDTPTGRRSLADLFEGRSQLFVKHFMFGPGQVGQCVGCSFEVDHIEGVLPHLNNHDITYVAIARAPLAEIEMLRKRMHWEFPFVSSFGSDFNYDFGVSFTPEEVASGRAWYNYGYTDPVLEDLSGNSVFYRDDEGSIFHTYSMYGRGGEEMLGTYAIIDVTPRGRDEAGPHRSLADWVRPRNRYGEGGTVERTGRYHPPDCACSVHPRQQETQEAT